MDDFKVASRQAWSSVAHDWGELIRRIDRQLGPAADWMLEAADPRPGETVLELACGPATVSLRACAAVGEDGRVICTDFSEEMVEVARARIAAEGGHENIECRVMDAEAVDLADGSVDVVLCRMGYMLMGDPAGAIAHCGRVLRPGGRIALAVWAEGEANPWAMLPMTAILEHLALPPPPPDAPTLWALADPDRLQRLLTDAGLTAIRTEALDATVEYESVEDLVDMTARLAGPARALFASLDDDARRGIIDRLRGDSAPYEHHGRIAFPERIRVAAATKPDR